VYYRKVLGSARAASAPAAAGKPPLGQRSLLEPRQADELVRLYKMLANDTRLRLLHALERAGELCVTDLADQLGMRPQAVSNQLQRLADRRIVAARRDGTRLYYRIADPCVPGLLDLGLCLLEESGRITPAVAAVAGTRQGRRTAS
jgi:DNA-binding transcriptional ArsR family regulator